MQTQKKKSNWASLLTALLTGAITIMNALVIDHCISKKSRLSYGTHVSQPFEKDSLQLRIYNLELLNDGDEMLEDIKGIIQFNGQQIMAYKLKGSPRLSIRDSLTTNGYSLRMDNLNPMEKLAMDFLVAGSPAPNGLPTVDIRARGISANDNGNWKNSKLPLSIVLLMALAIAISIHAFLLRYGATVKKGIVQLVKPLQKQGI